MNNLIEINLEEEAKKAALAYCVKIKQLCYQIESRGDRLFESDEMMSLLNEIRNDDSFHLPERVRVYPYICDCGVIWNKLPGDLGVLPTVQVGIKPCSECDTEMYERLA